jgi:hypothetical protein
VSAHGGGFYSAEDITKDQAQWVWYGDDPTTAAAMGSAYGDAFEKAYALYKQIPGHAEGLSSVPYDNYLARLHAGEAVIDADTMEALRGYGIPVRSNGGGISAADLAELRTIGNRTNAILEQLAERSSVDLQTQTSTLEAAAREAARDVTNGVLGAVEARVRA